jgi:TolB protein
MLKRIIAIGLTGGLCISTLTACQKSDANDRIVIDKGNKQITVIGNKAQEENHEIALEKIDSLKNIRAMDWIDENTLLVMKENSEYPEIQLDRRKAYPQNLYEYDINTQNFKLASGSKNFMSNAVLSPDRKYIFYKEGVENNLTGFILNRETGEKVQVTHTDSISSSEGKWIDNNTVVFSEFPQGGIYTADKKGNVKPVENGPKGMVSNTAVVKDKLYYTTMDGKLYVQNINGTGKKLLKENIVWLIPLADADTLILVKRTEKTKMALVIADLEGNEKKTLSEGTQIFGANWSPDQSKIAYSVAPDNSGKAGVFVSDINTGKTVQLTVDTDLAADELRWSPDGKKILESNLVNENSERYFITQILKLK